MSQVTVGRARIEIESSRKRLIKGETFKEEKRTKEITKIPPVPL